MQGDELAVTTTSEVIVRVQRIARSYLRRPLTAAETRRVRELARSATPSEITRVLYRWRGNLSDRLVRTLQPRADLSAIMWA